MTDTFDSVNPARPADVVGTYPKHDATDVNRAVASAAEAQLAWAKVPVPHRADLIAAAGAVIAHRKAEIAHLVSREIGKIVVEAGGDVQEAVDMAYFVAGQGRSAWGDTVPSELSQKMAWTTRIPVGVVGMITPWNFPIAIPSWKCFPALLAGNGIVLKPSEFAPACAEAFVDCCVEAGIPRALLQLVHGEAEPAAALATHAGVGAVSFTGSVPTGRKVAVTAMESGPRVVSLELGGKNAMVVWRDADLDLAAEGALFGAFGTAGQRCTSTSRLIVHPDVAGDLVARIVAAAGRLKLGDPTVGDTDVGPVVHAGSAARIVGMIEAAVGEGATVACGGQSRDDVDGCEGGTFVEPTVLAGVQPNHVIAREEVFGPVLSVIEADDIDAAVDIVNSVEYGLSAAVYTRDINTALRAVDAIDTGIVYVNAPTIGAEIPLPFGGTKHTGNGFREAGTRGIEQFSHVKTVYVDYSGRLQKAQIDTHGDTAVKLEAVELRRVALPLVAPFRTSFGVETHKDALLVRAIGADAEGWGECVAMEAPLYSSEYVDAAQHVTREHLLPRLFALGDVAASAVGPTLDAVKGHRMAKAAVETAVLDAELRAADISFATHLGGVREAVDSGVSVGIMDSVDELLDTVAGYLAAGYKRIKLKIEPGADVDRVRAVRERFGDDVLLQVDANTAYTLADAAHLAQLDPFNLLLIEQPLPEDDILGHADLAKLIRTPVCLDESIESARHAAAAIRLGAAAIVNIKPGRVGGYLEARRIHDVCVANGVPVWCGGMLETGIGRAANVALASLPGFTLPGDISASDRYFHRDLTTPFALVDGQLRVPTGPGIGVTPLADVLAELTTSVETITA